MISQPTPTLNYVVAIEFKLVPGDLFYYVWPLFSNITDAVRKVNEGGTWENEDMRIYGFGEWFNCVGRHQVTQKLTPIQFLDYVNAH